MNKKKLGGIAALSLAALTAVPTFSIVASADMVIPSTPSTISISDCTVYRIPVYSGTTYTYKYYTTKDAASGAIMGTHPDGTIITPTAVYASTFLTNGQRFTISGNEILPSTNGAYVFSTSGSTGSSSTSSYYGYAYASDKVYYSTLTRRYYPNATAYLSDPANKNQPLTTPTTPAQPYDSEHTWFDYSSGTYIRSSDYTGNAYYISGGKNNAYNDVGYNSSTGKYTVYYSSSTKKYYDTWQAAVDASPNSSYVTSYSSSYTAAQLNNGYGDIYNYNWSSYASSSYPWYSYVTGRYYATQSEALRVSGYDYNKVVNAYSYSTNNGYLYGYYYDPSYYYWNTLGNNNNNTAAKDNSSVTIGKSKGWTAVRRTINSAKNGASYTVNMNTENEIPENVLKTLKGKNVTINFKFSNGTIFSINGNDITSTNALNINIAYGSSGIPSSLRKKAVKANNGVSTSQFSINGGSFGATASVTVKFNTKRAGCSAKLYIYDAVQGSLSLVSRSSVKNNGQCEFSGVKQGGAYVVVLS